MSAERAQIVDARVVVTRIASGFSVEVPVSGGRFVVQGLEPGGPYRITARSVGFSPQTSDNVFLTLGDMSEIRLVLQPVAVTVDTVSVSAHTGSHGSAHNDGGTGTTISASVLEHLPTLNRDLYDFLRLVPQISTKISLANPGASAAGVGFRFNNFLINGVSERTLSGGVSRAFTGGKSIPLDAVEEYQVLLAPYDIRYGDFSGAMVNAVTKSGTNAFHGSTFGYGRNDALSRQTASTPTTSYERAQYGFSVGGPIVRDRLHFFIAPEFQHFTFPAAGPYVGEPKDAERAVPVSAANLARFDSIMASKGIRAGSPGPIENGNPLLNAYTRIDLALPEWNSRLLVWNNYTHSQDIAFSRTAVDTFSLSSYQVNRIAQSRTSVLDFHTDLPRAGGGHNELLISYASEDGDAIGAVQQPIVRVSVPSISGGSVTLNTGTNEAAQGNWNEASTSTIRDNLALPFGANHLVTVGSELDRLALRRGPPSFYGTWNFSSLDNLELGTAESYEIRIDFGTSATPLDGTQWAAYAEDQWQATDRVSVTGGLRADMLGFDERPPYQARVDSFFARRTDEMPRQRVELSPRLGFSWDLAGIEQHRLRGGIGIFASRYPLGWVQTALSTYGVGGLLRCSRVRIGAPIPPAFNSSPLAPPTTCAGGATLTSSSPGDVDVLDKNLRMARVLRSSLAYDRHLAGGLVSTSEGLVTRTLSDFAFVNMNLADPVGTDSHGRVMYGTINSAGTARPNLRSPFSEVIDIRNVARGGSQQFSTRLEKTQTLGFGGFISYTYSRTRDVETPFRVNTRGTIAWSSARVLSGRQDDLTTGVSANDIPHRVIVAGTYIAPWSRARTEFSFYYVGESGRPFTYTATGTPGRGDLNADGSNGNDPIYVPRSALDSLELQVSGASDSVGADTSLAARSNREHLQRKAFEHFIQTSGCLRRQRGKILERNTCREPSSNTTIASVRQAIPFARRAVEVELEVFNVLNLLNRDWGQVRQVAAPGLLEQVGETNDPGQAARPIFRFNASAPRWTTDPIQSAFQLQLALRYRF